MRDRPTSALLAALDRRAIDPQPLAAELAACGARLAEAQRRGLPVQPSPYLRFLRHAAEPRPTLARSA